MIQTPNKYVKDIVKYTSSQPYHIYEILDYLITPSQSMITTDVYVDGTTVVEMTVQINNRVYAGPHFFSSNDTNTDNGWHEPGTWGLQFEDAGNNLSIKIFGADYSTLGSNVIKRTGITLTGDLISRKLRYNLTASGYLTIYDTSDNVYKSYDVSQYTDTSYVSSTPIKLFNRFAAHEPIAENTYVYDCKIWQNNVLTHNYVPAKRVSDNVVGMYDILNDVFYVNEKSGQYFIGVSKSVPEYIDGTTTALYHINKIYNRGNIYWGNEYFEPPLPIPSRYLLCDYIQNNDDTSTYQSRKATFSIPWTPSPTLSHRIVVNMTPILLPSNYASWTVLFGGNITNMQHMAEIFGAMYNISNKYCYFSAFGEPTIPFFTGSGMNNYFNKLWHFDISNEAGSSNTSINYNVKLDIDNVNVINSNNTTTSIISGTYDPYFIFGGQVEHSDTKFVQVQFKLHSFDIYDNDVLVYQLRPVYDTTSQLYGMYDIVNDIFYSSINPSYPFTGQISQ